MDYATIKQHVSMDDLLDRLGIARDSKGRCACPLHGGDNKTAFSVHSQGNGWTCHTKCDASGDIFTFMERFDGIDNAQARVRIMELFALSDDTVPKQRPKASPPKQHADVVRRTSYVYRDREGKELYTVKRVDYADGKKDCFQSYQGKPTLPEAVRTLYNLDKIASTEQVGDYVCLAEGEKTADAVTACGYVGTTNPLGSKNWCGKYAQLLAGRKVVIMPDADEHGEKWRDEVLKSLQGVAAQVQIIDVPSAFIAGHPEFSGHDFADMLQVLGQKDATNFLMDALESEKVLPLGVDPSILGRPADTFAHIQSMAMSGKSTTVFNFNEWIDGLFLRVKRGDLIVLMANTGVGKTRALHNLPFHIRRLNWAIFDLELSAETLALRYAAMENKCNFREIEDRLESRKAIKPPSVDNVFIQKMRDLSTEKIRERVELIEKVTGRDIHCVAVDYIGLMHGKGSIYERTSANTEDFKAYVSESGKVGILTTQVTRPEDRGKGQYSCPSPFDCKNSGSLENSAQTLLGFWKPSDDPHRLCCRVLKYTHGEHPRHNISLDANDLLIRAAYSTAPLHNQAKEPETEEWLR